MSRLLMLRRIILPRAFRIALPAYTNDVVFTFQATSLVSIITIMDLTGVARVLVSRSFAAFEIWIFVGIIYCAISYAILYGFKLLESVGQAICGAAGDGRQAGGRRDRRGPLTLAERIAVGAERGDAAEMDVEQLRSCRESA